MGACSGDAGAPVIRENGQRLELVGIVNWTTGPRSEPGCGGLTGVVPLSTYRSWIVETAKKLASSVAAPATLAQNEEAKRRSAALRPSQGALVPLQSEGGAFTVPVSINDRLTLSFVVDSGAADVSIPADVVLTLMRTNPAAEQGGLRGDSEGLPDRPRRDLPRRRQAGRMRRASRIAPPPASGSMAAPSARW